MHDAFIVGVEPPPLAPPVPEVGEVPPPTPAVATAGEPACVGTPICPASGAAGVLPAFAELTRPAAPDVLRQLPPRFRRQQLQACQTSRSSRLADLGRHAHCSSSH